jgi:hypothetical protein
VQERNARADAFSAAGLEFEAAKERFELYTDFALVAAGATGPLRSLGRAGIRAAEATLENTFTGSVNGGLRTQLGAVGDVGDILSARVTNNSVRETVLANISETRLGNASSNLGGGLIREAVQIPEHTFRQLLENRGFSSSDIANLRQTVDGPLIARHGVSGEGFILTETAPGTASGRFVTFGSAGETPEIRRSVLALPPNNLGLVESSVFLARPQILLEGRVAPQPTFGAYATGGGLQVITDGGFRNGALIRR